MLINKLRVRVITDQQQNFAVLKNNLLLLKNIVFDYNVGYPMWPLSG